MATENPQALLTGALAARRVNVSKQLVCAWRRAGHLKPAGATPQGHPLYRLCDVLLAERLTRRSPNSHRAR